MAGGCVEWAWRGRAASQSQAWEKSIYLNFSYSPLMVSGRTWRHTHTVWLWQTARGKRSLETPPLNGAKERQQQLLLNRGEFGPCTAAIGVFLRLLATFRWVAGLLCWGSRAARGWQVSRCACVARKGKAAALRACAHLFDVQRVANGIYAGFRTANSRGFSQRVKQNANQMIYDKCRSKP